MTGLNQFLDLFGQVTLSTVIGLVLAGVFLYMIYKKVREYFICRYEEDKKRDEQLNEALTAVHQLPVIQKKLEEQMDSIAKAQERSEQRLQQIEEDNKRRARNQLRDRLLQCYRYYTNSATNPSKSWTRMEAEAFWELFHDYESDGGNGYMHSVVQPTMEELFIRACPIPKNEGGASK